jgi:hypothetical protein
MTRPEQRHLEAINDPRVIPTKDLADWLEAQISSNHLHREIVRRLRQSLTVASQIDGD